MEVFVFLMSLILSATIANATPSEEDREACRSREVQTSPYLTREKKKELLDMCLKNRESATAAANLRSQIQTLRDKEQDCFKDDRRFFARLLNRPQRAPTAADVQRCEAAAKAKQDELDKLNGSLAQQEKDLAAAESTYRAQNTAAAATSEQRRELDNIVNDEFNKMKLSIFGQKLQASDAALQLTKMATAVDNSAMGLYLRDRMAGLLNSTSFCDAAKACPAARTIKGSDLNGVFNSTMNTGVNKEREVTSSAPGGASTQPAAGTSQ
jgi:hypothetical protein